MKRILMMALVPVLFAAPAVQAADVKVETAALKRQTVSKNGAQTSFKGPEQFLTGNVKGDMLFLPTAELPASGASVTFGAGARTAWHTHPAGQSLIVTSGAGRTQQWGGPVVDIGPGDVIRCPAGVKHWHGAAPDSGMTHLAITGELNGKNVDWMEKVTDEQYLGK